MNFILIPIFVLLINVSQMMRSYGINGQVKSTNLGFCDACAEGKQRWDSFNGTRIRTKRPLERIRSDVCGLEWCKVFIDDFTHFGVIYVIKKKSDVSASLQEYE